MKHYPQRPNNRLKTLVVRFENLSQNKETTLLRKSEYLLLADYFEHERFPSRALDALDYGISTFKKSPELLVRKTRLLIYNFGFQAAKDFLNQSSTSVLKPHQVELLQLEILIAQGKVNDALSVVAALKYQYTNTRTILSEVFYMEALAYEKANHFEKSFEALSEVLWANPNHQDAKGKIWMTTELSKKSKEGILLNKFLLKKEHYSSISWFNIAHAYYSEGEYEKAIEAFEFCIIINEDFQSAYLDLAEVCMLLNMFQKAAQFLAMAFEKFEIEEVDRIIQFGESLIKSGEFRNARTPLINGLLIDAHDPDMLFLMAETYRLDGKYDLATQYFETALEVDFTRDDIHKNLGKIYFLQAEFEKAKCHFEMAIENNPFEGSYRTELASFYLNIGEMELSESVLSEAIEEIPDVNLLYHYAAILLADGKEKEGLDILGKALQEDFSKNEEVYEFAPELIGNKKIESIIKYYKGEQ